MIVPAKKKLTRQRLGIEGLIMSQDKFEKINIHVTYKHVGDHIDAKTNEITRIMVAEYRDNKGRVLNKYPYESMHGGEHD